MVCMVWWGVYYGLGLARGHDWDDCEVTAAASKSRPKEYIQGYKATRLT